jgi:hypothetical protein
MNFIVPCIGNVIIPTDELHHFSEGVDIPPTSVVLIDVNGVYGTSCSLM